MVVDVAKTCSLQRNKVAQCCLRSSNCEYVHTVSNSMDDMCGPVLLVGEGNFSFSAALCRLSPQSHVTATCLQPQEDLRHEGAVTHIQTIRALGMLIHMMYSYV